MKNKNCSGTTFLQSFSLLIFLLAGFIPSAYAHHQFLSWTPFPQQFQFTKQFRGIAEPIVTIAWGSIEYLSNDLTPGVCRAGDKENDTFHNDTINAVADIYVVESGKVYPNSSVRIDIRPLDVTGAVNTIIQDSGNFFNEPIGTIGGGTGQINAGKYAVVYDECQDGYFDDNVDFFFNSAFEVGAEVFSLPTAEVNDLKARAGDQAVHYAQVAALTKTLQLVYKGAEIFAKGKEIVDVVLNPEKLGEWFITSVSERVS